MSPMQYLDVLCCGGTDWAPMMRLRFGPCYLQRWAITQWNQLKYAGLDLESRSKFRPASASQLSVVINNSKSTPTSVSLLKNMPTTENLWSSLYKWISREKEVKHKQCNAATSNCICIRYGNPPVKTRVFKVFQIRTLIIWMELQSSNHDDFSWQDSTTKPANVNSIVHAWCAMEMLNIDVLIV